MTLIGDLRYVAYCPKCGFAEGREPSEAVLSLPCVDSPEIQVGAEGCPGTATEGVWLPLTDVVRFDVNQNGWPLKVPLDAAPSEGATTIVFEATVS